MTLQFPSLFVNADRAAASRQKTHFRLLYSQYILLFLASSVTLFGSSPVLGLTMEPRLVAIIYLVFIFLAILALVRSASSRPEREWYNARAIAESVKTTTWRYVMKAEPFDASVSDDDVDKVFADRLEAIKSGHDQQGAALRYGAAQGEIITPSMAEVRALSFKEKKSIYIQDRITNQLGWYRSKSLFNDKRSKLMSWACMALYSCAVIMGLVQIYHAGDEISWISEPLLVAAAGFLGWTQARRYAELATSYNLAAHEIQHVKTNVEHVKTPEDFALAVIDAESAFSREHTQWVARQSQS